MSLDTITSAAFKLDKLQRLALVQAVLDSIAREEVEKTEPALTPAQANEIANRLKLFAEGKMKTIPARQALAKLKEKHGLHR